MTRLLLDTHILLWWTGQHPDLSLNQRRALRKVAPQAPAFASEISLWEIGMLVGRGRLDLERPLRDILEEIVAPPLVARIGITPAIAAEVATLSPHVHGDPADRILIATARVLGATLVTSDERMHRLNLVPCLA